MSDTDIDPNVPTPAEAAPASLYGYATWVHVPFEASDDPECWDPEGFHAWCRLPNKLQFRTIRDRALAAKARKLRQLRLDGTDGNEIIEAGIEELFLEEDFKTAAVDELMSKEWAANYLEAVALAQRIPDPEGEDDELDKLFAHIEDDQIRYNRLQALPVEDRNMDEWDELAKRLTDYQEAVNREFDGLVAPKRASLLALDEDKLADMVRRDRMKAVADDEYHYTYSIQEILSCTYTDDKACKQVYASLAKLELESPEIVQALEEAFSRLERNGRDASGN